MEGHRDTIDVGFGHVWKGFAGVALVLFGCAVLGIYFLSRSWETDGRWLVVLICLWGVVMLAGGLVMLRQALDRRPVLVLTPEGLRDRRLGNVLLPWSAVRRAVYDPPYEGAGGVWRLELAAPTDLPIPDHAFAPSGFRDGFAAQRDRLRIAVDGLDDAAGHVATALARFAPHVEVEPETLRRPEPRASGAPVRGHLSEKVVPLVRDRAHDLTFGTLALVYLLVTGVPLFLIFYPSGNWTAFLFFAFALNFVFLFALPRLPHVFLRGPVVTLSPDGFRDRRLGRGLVPWASVRRVVRRSAPLNDIWEFHLSERPEGVRLRWSAPVAVVWASSLLGGSEAILEAVERNLPHLGVDFA